MVKFVRKYRAYQFLFSFNFIVIVMFFIFLGSSRFYSYNEYTKLNAIYVVDNIIHVVLTNKEFKQLEKNRYLYLNSVKKKVNILSVTKNIYKRENIFYHQVSLEIKGVSDSTTLNVSMLKKKENVVNLFRTCFEEE